MSRYKVMCTAAGIAAGVASACVANPPDADLGAWNDATTRPNNNCYNYGVNTETGTFAQPGRKGCSLKAGDYRTFLAPFQQKCKDRTLTMDDLCKIGDQYEAWAKRDGLESVDAGDVDPTKINDIGEGYCLVALVVGCIELKDGSKVIDYHWFRQNGDAGWSHKPGGTAAREEDNKGNKITDPSSLPDADNDDNSDATQYDKFVGYMKYKPGGVNIKSDYGLVSLPDGVARALITDQTEVDYGWLLDMPGEIDQIMEMFLVDQLPVENPGWDKDPSGFQGVSLEFGAGTLGGPFGGLPTRVRAFKGVKEISVELDDGTVETQYFLDVGLDQLVWSQAQFRTEMFPGAELFEDPTCLVDCDANGALNILDFVCFQALFQSGDAGADINDDGVLNILDFVAFQGLFQAGCD